ncbi:uncharacterized protein MONBRDRAFT_15140, partial [Monosiga brevicollis MX1]
YLLIYSMLVAADWVQGPYMYRLYQAYGFTLAQNGQLFIAGFASSMVFGTVAGTLADRFGRKRGTILYTLVYGLSCLTKHARDFPTLMVGRILGGLATSLLFTVPESWVVAEHGRRRLSDSTLTALFADMSVINGLTAIGAGWLAEGAVAAAQHPVGAFDLSLVLLILGGLAVSLCWSENFGDQTVGVVGHLWEGMATVTSSPQLSALAAVQSIFEAAMYVFVFLYTPALQRVAGRDDLPFGTLFACLMVAVAMGGGLAKLLLSYGKWTASRLLVVVMLGAAVACAGLALASSTHQFLGAMLAFEVLVGMYWPCISTVRSRLIPEALRATILNLFRVPLNVFVCTALLGIDQWPESVTLGLCGAALMGGESPANGMFMRGIMPTMMGRLSGQDWSRLAPSDCVVQSFGLFVCAHALLPVC